MINFIELGINERTDALIKTIWIIKYIKLIGKKLFLIVALDWEEETDVEKVNSLTSLNPNINDFWQIQIGVLFAVEVFTPVLNKNIDLVLIFLPNLAIWLPKHVKMNDYKIEHIENDPVAYRSIYSLRYI